MRGIVGLVIILCACLTAQAVVAHDPPKPPGVVHVVLVWLKKPGDIEHRKQIIEATKQLQDIPGVLDLRVGEVVPSDREVVDASFDVALYLRFASQEALQSYLAHPLHQTLVKEELAPLMERYRVFDFEDQ